MGATTSPRKAVDGTSSTPDEPGAGRWPRALLVGGILASVLYVAMMLFVGLLWDGYSAASRTISELSAIDAPTRPLWMLLGTVYTVLIIAFGWIVWKSAPPNRALRVVGAVLVIHGLAGYFWPPMHQREVLAAGGATLTDTLHVAWMMVTGVFFMIETGFGAAALGKRFRVFSIATMAIVVACGFATGTYTSRIEANLPTPWVGVWERVSAGVYMLWIAVLSVTLLRRSTGARRMIERGADRRGGPGRADALHTDRDQAHRAA